MEFLNVKTKVNNVVCTASLEQAVDIRRMGNLPCGIYDEAIYGGRCGYVKMPDMKGRVTVFPSGKMISVGAISPNKAVKQLQNAKFYLAEQGLIQDIKIHPVIRNIVATADTHNSIPINILSSKISGAVYDPETFPAMILKGFSSCSFLIFASGKIVITGAKSLNELKTSLSDLLIRLDN